jgi:HNH endonuclease
MPIAVGILPSQANIIQRLRYDVTSPSCLVWNDYKRGNPRLDALHVNQYANKPAGNFNGMGYWIVSLDGKRFLAHRLIWKMHHDAEPVEIDHIDGNPRNNRIENLRAADRRGNTQNIATRRGTKSGLRGVHPSGNRFFARIVANGVMHHLGSYATKEEAHAAWVAAARLLYGEFARTQEYPNE